VAQTVTWSPEALDDLDEIAAFIARDSLQHARSVVAHIFEAADLLAEMPSRGRLVPELGRKDMREIFVFSFRVLYRADEGDVIIEAIIHGSRLLGPDGLPKA
jgi:plasmid stabilization system protein ParE